MTRTIAFDIVLVKSPRDAPSCGALAMRFLGRLSTVHDCPKLSSFRPRIIGAFSFTAPVRGGCSVSRHATPAQSEFDRSAVLNRRPQGGLDCGGREKRGTIWTLWTVWTTWPRSKSVHPVHIGVHPVHQSPPDILGKCPLRAFGCCVSLARPSGRTAGAAF